MSASKQHFCVEVYKTGCIIHRPPDSLNFTMKEPPKRGVVRDASKRSLIRGAFAMSNCPRPWGAMLTLTLKDQPKDLKLALRKFFRTFRNDNGRNVQWAWFMEFQKRGVVHYHVFFEKPWLEENHFLDDLQIVRRRNKQTGLKHEVILIRGDFERYCIDTWLAACGDEREATRRFNEGGILEVLRSSDGAGRYMARYVGKQEQKKCPASVEKVGRYWEVNPRFRAKPLGYFVAKHWPFPWSYKYVFDANMLNELTCEERSNYKLPPTDEELGALQPPCEVHEQRDGRWTFVSYSHPELNLDNQSIKEVK